MKTKNALLSILCLLITSLYSQEESFILTKSVKLEMYDLINDKPFLNKTKVARKGWKFKIDHYVDGGVIIRFWPWNSSKYDDEFYQEVKIVGKKKKYLPIYFYMDDATFDNATEEYVIQEKEGKLSAQVGVVTIPIKLRPSNDEKYESTGENDFNNDRVGQLIRPFDFDGGFNLGLSLGLRYDFDEEYHFIVVGGINIASEKIDNSVLRRIKVEENLNEASVSPFTGLILGRGNSQVTLLVGWDYLSGNIGDNWVYQGKPWVGVGLGLNIFNVNLGSSKENKENEGS